MTENDVAVIVAVVMLNVFSMTLTAIIAYFKGKTDGYSKGISIGYRDGFSFVASTLRRMKKGISPLDNDRLIKFLEDTVREEFSGRRDD